MGTQSAGLTSEVISSPFSGYLERTKITPNSPRYDILGFLEECQSTISTILQERLVQLGGLKYWLCVSATFHKTEGVEELSGYFPNTPQTILNSGEVSDSIQVSFAKVADEIESFEAKGSNWVLRDILHADLYTVGYTPLRASCYKELPAFIKVKKAIVNINNDDDLCFMWSVLAGLHPTNAHAGRVTQYAAYANELNFDGIEFPVKLKDIKKFTGLNGISVNVFTYSEKNRIYPIYRAEERLETHINLFFYREHYSFIRNFDRLMGDQNAHKTKKHFCDMCLFPMYDAERLRTHREHCTHQSMAILEMPSEGKNVLKFTNVQKMLRKPLVVYADFEAILKPIDMQNQNNRSYTAKYQEHVPCSYGMVMSKSCCSVPQFEGLHIETSYDPAGSFIDRLVTIADDYSQVANREPLNVNDAEQERFVAETTCFICEKELGTDRVRDHCHVCGRFRGALHGHCNQMLRLDRNIVVVMHNLRHYDAHIIMRSVGEAAHNRGLNISCIPRGAENYVTFSLESKAKKWKIRFIDSAQFLPASLEKLVQQLSPEDFKCMMTYFEPDEINLLSRKGVFPYDHLSSWQRLDDRHPIPKECFYNKLSNKHVSDADYEHYKQVVIQKNVSNLKEYMELYLKMDTLQLADVFEGFRKFSLENYGLDPCHYSTLPGLGWDSCLKMTKVELELLTDPDMYAFFESGIRGGISVISHRKASANNKYMASWNEEEQQAFIVYYDANNLYGWSMCEKLPTSGFRWLTTEEIESLNVEDIDPDASEGYVLEVDLEYPPEKHDEHNDYPLAPEKLLIEPTMLSDYCKRIAIQHHLKSKPVQKLAPNLMDKKKYIVHIRNLQYYLEQGLILKKIHRVVAFRQSAWMANYVKFNTEKRKEATDKFAKDLYKFFVNACFGKTMENVRKYMTVELVTDQRRLRKIAKKPTFKRACIFTDHLVACCMDRSTVVLNKPIYVGFVVLDLSKLLMFEFHYEYMRKLYGNRAVLCMTDTDSLLYVVKTDGDIYADMLLNSNCFDTSDYPEDHFLCSQVNKKVVGKMKDELNGEAAEEFVGLRSKMYSLRVGSSEKKRAKGIKRKVVEDDISHADYAHTLDEERVMHHKMRCIRSYKHKLYSIELQKKSLSCFDDKRYILDDGVSTLAYGHYSLRQTAAAGEAGEARGATQ